MNEHEFRDALRASMSVTPQPPPMGEATVLEAARRDRTRRRAMWAGAGSAVAVAAIAVGVVLVAPSTSEEPGLDVGGAPSTDLTAQGRSEDGSAPEDTDKQTETSWPNGQTDRTATSGPRADQGVALMTELDGIVPAGYEAPEGKLNSGELSGAPMRSHQAAYVDTVDGTEVWDYLADLTVTKGDGVGRVMAQVYTPGHPLPGVGCEAKGAAWGIEGTCTEVVVGGERVAVITDDTRDEIDQFEQAVVYRHDDGTVVTLAQSTFRAFTDLPPLDGLPFTTEQLTELVTDPRFHLD